MLEHNVQQFAAALEISMLIQAKETRDGIDLWGTPPHNDNCPYEG
jgi:hypothetical protein